MRRLLIRIFVIGLIVFSPLSLVAAQTSIGYALEIQGDWRLNSNSSTPLRRWQKLPPGGSISIQVPTREAQIVIVSLSGQLIETRKCWKDDCSRPINLPKLRPQRSVLGLAFEAAAELIFGSPPRYSVHRNRTFDGLSDGVARLDKDQIDLTPLLKQTGRYYVSWRPRPLRGRPGRWSDPVGIRMQLGQPSLVPVTNFKPGLYEINLQRQTGEIYETFASAWILVSAHPNYDRAVASFQQAVDLTEQWGTNVEPYTSQQFLRAYLDYLAQQARKER